MIKKASKTQSLKDTKKKKELVKTSETTKTAINSKKITKEPETMEELLAMTGYTPHGMKKGDMIEGVVFSISPKEVLVDMGKKSFGIVAEWELEQVREYVKSLKVGQKVSAQVVNPENEVGYAILSLRRASSEIRWNLLAEKKEKDEELEVSVVDTTKGGVLIDWQGLRGFIPPTQLEMSHVTNPGVLIGRTVKAKILELDKKLNRFVLSEKAASGEGAKIQAEALEKVKVGETVKGKISGVAPFGIFVDVDGIGGLVHISEISWEKVENPAVLFKVGQAIDIIILDVNREEGRLNLSIKRLTPDPWKNILDRYPIEANVKGKAVRTAPYGVFIQLEPGIEGLLHVSKIPPGENIPEGSELECVVELVDETKRKISLTLMPKAKPMGYR